MGDGGNILTEIERYITIGAGPPTLFKMMEFILVNMDHKHKKTGIASCYSKKMTSLEDNNQVGLHLSATIQSI